MKMNRVGLIGLLCLWLGLSNAFPQSVRPIRDDVGYCWKSSQMQRLVEYMSESEKDSTPSRSFIAAISPHDDYLYAGRVYLPLFRSIRTKEALVFGVTHRTVRTAIGDPKNILILDQYRSWKGLGREVSISPLREFIRTRLDTSYFAVNNRAHELEHSIEALLPFLQYFNPGARITPLMITPMPFERMEEISGALAKVISEYLWKNNLVPGRDFIFLISSDANHYGVDFSNVPFGDDKSAHERATEQDKQLCDTFIAGTLTTDKIRDLDRHLDNVVWCGRYSIPFGLLTVRKTMDLLGTGSITGITLRYSDSFTEGAIPLKGTGMGTTAPFSLKHWVGWFSAGFSPESR